MQKFMFDGNDFDKAKVPEKERPVYTEEHLNAARNESHARGKADGVKESRASQEAQITALLEKFSQTCERMIAAEEEREILRMQDAARLALRIVQKLMPQLSTDLAMKEIERVILQSLEIRKDEPRISVTIAPVHMEALQSRLEALAQEKGFAGKTTLLADEHMSPQDCRLEWADGGAERLYERLYAQIESEFAKAIDGMKTSLDEIKNA